jgi:2-polyprenyl-3-methyl-5-hydroxy-6-metoxy-1,4-benzoquinol methylase
MEARGSPANSGMTVPPTMKSADVAASYNQLAHRWINLEQSKNGIAQHERAIAFLDRKRYALDVGCGSSGRLVDLLIQHSFHVEGVDISEQMIAFARQRHAGVTFYHADICEWQLPRQYDLISAWDSIWHVPLEEQRLVLKKIMKALTPGGVLIFTTPGLDVPSEKVDSAMGPEMYYSGLGIPSTLELVAEAGCICRHLEYDQHPELHLYLIVQRAG